MRQDYCWWSCRLCIGFRRICPSQILFLVLFFFYFRSLVQTNEHLLRELNDTKQRHQNEVQQLNWSYNQLKKSMNLLSSRNESSYLPSRDQGYIPGSKSDHVLGTATLYDSRETWEYPSFYYWNKPYCDNRRQGLNTITFHSHVGCKLHIKKQKNLFLSYYWPQCIAQMNKRNHELFASLFW